MRGQGLPISVIIGIALGMIVLIVLGGILIRGGGTFARSTQQSYAIQECRSLCNNLKSWAMNLEYSYVHGITSWELDILRLLFNKCINKPNPSLTNCPVETADGYICDIYAMNSTCDSSVTEYPIASPERMAYLDSCKTFPSECGAGGCVGLYLYCR